MTTRAAARSGGDLGCDHHGSTVGGADTSRPRSPPGVVPASIRPFGSTGPYAGYRAHHLTVFHAGGEGADPSQRTGLQAVPRASADPARERHRRVRRGVERGRRGLAACYGRLRSDRGQRIDVSIQESELTLNRTRLSRYNNDGVVLHREAEPLRHHRHDAVQ